MTQELYEKRLGHVERDVAGMRAEIDGLTRAVSSIDSGVQRLLQRDSRSPYDLKDMLSIAVSAAVLIGLTVSAIIYVAGGYYAADIALLKYKVGELRNHVPSTWSTSVNRK